MKKIYISAIFMLVASLFLLTACGQNENVNFTSTNKTTSKSDNTVVENEVEKEEVEPVNFAEAAEKQMAKPEDGETVAIIKVKNFGEIKVKFFDEIAPKAVENFITHAKNGYYNGLVFHRVINEFMIQGGDPTGTGMGGESIWGTGFGTELSQELVPYKGSLCMAMSSAPNSIGSQFFITQANYSDTMNEYMKLGGFPEKLLEQYKKYGGYLSLFMQYTVFGQAYEGLDVLDKIAAVETHSVPLVINGINYGNQEDRPVEDVIIEKVEVTTYKAD